MPPNKKRKTTTTSHRGDVSQICQITRVTPRSIAYAAIHVCVPTLIVSLLLISFITSCILLSVMPPIIRLLTMAIITRTSGILLSISLKMFLMRRSKGARRSFSNGGMSALTNIYTCQCILIFFTAEFSRGPGQLPTAVAPR
jgi:hypothetical protein